MIELARKAFHIISGTAIALLYNAEIINRFHLLFILIIGTILFFIYKKYKIPIIHTGVQLMERKQNMRDAGLSVLMFLIGCIIAASLYDKKIATASILILGWGDGIASVAGHYGRIKYFNRKKTWEGVICAIIAGTIASQFIVELWQAATATTIAMLIEGLDLKIYGWKIDDNLTIPVIAGIILTILS